MKPHVHNPGERRRVARPKDDLVSAQREANEKLVLATLRAEEEAEDARHALSDAEQLALALEERQAELQATAELRERLLGIIGHDLRGPLGAMIMSADLLASRSGLSAGDRAVAARLLTTSRRMARMIEQLLDFTRARLGGTFPLAFAETNLGDVCRHIADELRMTSRVELRVDVEGDVTGLWDADRLSQVIANIGANALDHARPGSAVVISVRADGDEHVVAEVTNEGDPIPQEILPVIFKAFRRAQVGYSRGGHLGLGLFISHEIATAHGGTLEARCADGKTTFRMRLPRTAKPAARLEAG